MEINVIIPVRDRASLIVATLDSVAAQTRRPDRLIIVDNGSTDATAEVVSGWMSTHPEINTTLLSESKPGASAARNRGLREIPDAEEQYVMFFDSDDLMHPTHIRRIADYLAKYPDTDLLYFDIAMRDPDGWTTVKSTPGEDPLIRSHIFHSILSTQRYAALVSLVNRCGGWDEELPRWNDYELGLRLAVNASAPRKLAGEPTVTILPHADSITGSSYSKDASILLKALDTMRRTLASGSMKQDLRYLHARRAIIAALFAREGAREIASSTLDDALDASQPGDRLATHLAYLVTRLTGHGGATIAGCLLSPPRPKRPTRLNPSGR